MIRDLELRLATVLGGRLPSPFANRVVAAPAASVPGSAPRIVVGVTRAEPLEPDLGHIRDEVVPGVAAPRRILRLRCSVVAEVQPGAGQGRVQQVEGLDALLFALEAPELRSGRALEGPADPGFLLHRLEPVDAAASLTSSPPPTATLRAEGLFWPVGSPGRAGTVILDVRLRHATLPLTVTFPPEPLVPGGAPAEIRLRLDAGALRLRPGQPAAGAPLGALALRLQSPEGGAGRGSLTGGSAGEGGARVVAIDDRSASVTYTPPSEPVVDQLVVSFEDNEAGTGVELGRVPLRVGVD